MTKPGTKSKLSLQPAQYLIHPLARTSTRTDRRCRRSSLVGVRYEVRDIVVLEDTVDILVELRVIISTLLAVETAEDTDLRLLFDQKRPEELPRVEPPEGVRELGVMELVVRISRHEPKPFVVQVPFDIDVLDLLSDVLPEVEWFLGALVQNPDVTEVLTAERFDDRNQGFLRSGRRPLPSIGIVMRWHTTLSEKGHRSGIRIALTSYGTADVLAIPVTRQGMPVPKAEFDDTFPCDFYTPDELLNADTMYTVYEIARLLQGLDPDADIDRETEDVLIDWAIPWIMQNSDDLVVAEPRNENEPGYYGLKT